MAGIYGQNLWSVRVACSSGLARESHARQYASHISEAGDHARHRIVGMNLILKIDEALVPSRDEGFKHLPHWHYALSHRDLALFALEVREVLHVYVEEPWACFVDRLNDIRAGADRMPDIDAAADARIHTLHRFKYIQWRMPQLVLRAMIVDRDADVVFLYEILDSRQSLRCRVARDNNADSRSLAVFELTSDIRIFILREIDGSGSVQLDARCGIVRERGCFLLRGHWEMVFDVLRIQREHVELLHETDHLRAPEVAEGVTGKAQTN